MAIGNFRSNNANFNRTMQQFIPFLMNQQLLKKRQSGFEALETQRQEGDIELEGIRSGNRREEAEQKFFFEVAQMPEMDQRIAVIFDKKRRGEDTTKEEAQLQDVSEKLFLVSLEASQGKLNPESARGVRGMSEKFMLNLFGEQGQSFRQERDIGQQVLDREERIKQREGVGEVQAATGAGRLALDVSEAGKADIKFQQKELLTDLRGIIDDLLTEGVKPTDMSDEEMIRLTAQMPQIKIGGGAPSEPKLRDPLTKKDRGKILQKLQEVVFRIDRGTLPTDAELAFASRARSTFQITKEGGPPSGDTGLFPSEDPQVRQRLIEENARALMSSGRVNSATGQPFTQEEAIIEATAYIDSLR